MVQENSSKYLDIPSSGEDEDQSYDSAEEEVKGRSALGHSSGRPLKRRRLDPDDSDGESDGDHHDSGTNSISKETLEAPPKPKPNPSSSYEGDEAHDRSRGPDDPVSASHTSSTKLSSSKPTRKPSKPGVVYLSRLPPYLKPSTLRTLLTQRGFHPITKVFLTPANASTHSNQPRTKRSNRRQTYTDGWIEFASRRTARLCAETLNATIVGGKKGGWYHDDVWNVKYLRGFGWGDLMEGVRRERKEAEARVDQERRKAGREARLFVERMERGKISEAMRKKRKKKGGENGEARDDAHDGDGTGEVRRTFRQNEVVWERERRGRDKGNDEGLDGDVKRVLSKIF
jgi:ESF2/ABP1 family protein